MYIKILTSKKYQEGYLDNKYQLDGEGKPNDKEGKKTSERWNSLPEYITGELSRYRYLNVAESSYKLIFLKIFDIIYM